MAKSSVRDNSPFSHWIFFSWKFLIRNLLWPCCRPVQDPWHPHPICCGSPAALRDSAGLKGPAGLSHQHWHTLVSSQILTHTWSGDPRCSVNGNIFFKQFFSSYMTVKRNTKRIIPKCYLRAGKSGSSAYVYIWALADHERGFIFKVMTTQNH